MTETEETKYKFGTVVYLPEAAKKALAKKSIYQKQFSRNATGTEPMNQLEAPILAEHEADSDNETGNDIRICFQIFESNEKLLISDISKHS